MTTNLSVADQGKSISIVSTHLKKQRFNSSGLMNSNTRRRAEKRVIAAAGKAITNFLAPIS